MQQDEFVKEAQNKLGTDVPLWLAVGWAKLESGFDETQTEVGVFSGGERGLFQISPAESNDYGFDHQRLSSTDVAYQFDCWLSLIAHYGDAVSARGADQGTATYWRLVKLCHGAGIGSTTNLLSNMGARGMDPNQWESVTSAANGTQLGNPSLAKWADQAQRVYTTGSTIANSYRSFFLTSTISWAQTMIRRVKGFFFWG